MARDLPAQNSVQQTPGRIAQHTMTMLDGGEHAGMEISYTNGSACRPRPV
ncbi:hypothetical protein FHX42_001268 [Saccharopolyspora lacisalsi]|uniref:Uncharacterized protein n=1 Tax=Halosaccharopolyspora lacisalsi TaxID=1000566 RepID=A0A839DT61_9PSEU|nr:hypothetical protein [Halosaccharopolyspora lacisalsi]MBA8823939.1 hypothetical protein [Halosaccharopolyspora lacisalsi]